MLLQSRRVITAAQMAAQFGLTERTIYRDLLALGEAGVPIMGEAGVAYSLRRGYHFPPVMFSPAEALALATGGLLAERMTDASVGERAVLEVTPLVLETVRRHWGPAIRQEVPGDGMVRVTLGFCGSDLTYLASWLMSFCRNIRILKPEKLRNRLVELALETARHHQSPPVGTHGS